MSTDKIHINKERLQELDSRVRDEKEMLSWRKLIIEIKKLFELENPEFDPLPAKSISQARNVVEQLTKVTPLEDLQNEILYALGFIKVESDRDLDALLVNAVHDTEPIFLTLFKIYKESGRKVAGFDLVGYYNDMQTRIAGPAKIFGRVKKMIFIASTQKIYGGSISVLTNVMRILRNSKIASSVEHVDVVMPMFGGSRGHREGQSKEVGYEVLEAIFNAKLLSLTTKDVLGQLLTNGLKGDAPQVKFYSIDIHNNEYPRKTFEDSGYDFVSISPSRELGSAFCEVLEKEGINNSPIKVVACDKGAVRRTQNLAESVLKNKNIKAKELEVIFFGKFRPRAGEVEKVKIRKIERWVLNRKKIKKNEQPILKFTEPSEEKAVLLYSDDMIDTGGTAIKDIELLLQYYPKTVLMVFAATHPVLSKGLLALDRINADYYLLGNTLGIDGLDEVDNVKIVDLALAVVNKLKE